jgi:hypothetical protein
MRAASRSPLSGHLLRSPSKVNRAVLDALLRAHEPAGDGSSVPKAICAGRSATCEHLAACCRVAGAPPETPAFRRLPLRPGNMVGGERAAQRVGIALSPPATRPPLRQCGSNYSCISCPVWGNAIPHDRVMPDVAPDGCILLVIVIKSVAVSNSALRTGTHIDERPADAQWQSRDERPDR